MEDRSSTCSSPHPRQDQTLTETPAKRSRKKSSEVWADFDEVEGEVKKVRCKWCPQVYIDEGYGTSNMKRHILVCPGLKARKNISKVPFEESKFREKLAMSLIKHNLPFSFVEYSGIRDLFEYLSSDVTTVCRNSIKADVLKIYMREKNVVKDALKSVSSNICLTADLWSSITSDGYLALTAHYVDENWSLRKRILQFRHVHPPHSGPILAGYLIDILKDWGIDKKVFTLTLDNASYNDGLVDMLKKHFLLNGSSICNGEFFHVRCGAHVLNLIVHAGLKIIEEPVSKIRECVKYVRASEARKLSFARCIDQVSLICNKKVSQDVATRWNSTYLMFDSALYFRLAFEQLRNVDSNFKSCPSQGEWEKVKQIWKFLRPFYDITTLFSGSNYPTANLYFNGVWRMESLINKEMLNTDEEVSEMALKMREKFDKYWECYSFILSFAVILDPRFKLEYVEHCFRKLYTRTTANDRVSKIREKFVRLFDDYSRRTSLASSSAPRVGIFGRNDDMDDEIDDITEFENAHRNARTNQSELDRYLGKARRPAMHELDLLRFWRDKSDRYPTLALMAKDILSIPITTVASESTFSIGGRVFGKYRSSLLPDTAEALVCTRDWLSVSEAHCSIEEESLFVDFAPLVAQLDSISSDRGIHID